MGLLEPHGRSRRPFRLALAPAIVVHTLAHAVGALRAAAASGRDIVLLSAADAGIYAGPGWFGAMIEAAREAVPQARSTAMLDCGDDAGAAMAAIRAGIGEVIFTGRPDVAERLAAIAAARGAWLLTARPETALDLVDLFFADAEAAALRCAAALADDGGSGV